MAAILACPWPAEAQPAVTPAVIKDARIAEALHRWSSEAGSFWQVAPGFVGRETVHQKALKKGKGAKAQSFETRDIESFYALATFRGAPEALREFRWILTIDGKKQQEEEGARRAFEAQLVSGKDEAKEALRTDFEKACLAGVATDFGQLILLFTKPNLEKYSYELSGESRLGADNAWQIAFTQFAGDQSLHLSEGRRNMSVKLQGELWSRPGDFLPLRIVVNARRQRDKNQIRDEAMLDYMVVPPALLPASLVYRRYVNEEMRLESVYRYSDWQAMGPK